MSVPTLANGATRVFQASPESYLSASRTGNMPIVVIGLSHRSSPVTVRERFAFAEARVPATLALMKEAKLVDEVVILSTCNRVEIYAATQLSEQEAFEGIKRFLVTVHDYRDPLTDEIYTLAEPKSIEHLFKVASGLDSMVLGETEILGQLKKAYDLALKDGHTGSRLNKAFQRAFNVAKLIRTETNIQRGSVSVGSVAVELAEKIFSNLASRNVLVIGAGDTSEKTARALLSRGAHSILVTNRSADKAVALAAELGGRAIPFENWEGEFDCVDIVISSTAAPNYVLDCAKLAPLMKSRRNRSLLIIDIAVPRDIEPQVNFMENVFLYNIDDLQAIAADYLNQRKEEVAHCERIIQAKAKALLEHHGHGPGGHGARPASEESRSSQSSSLAASAAASQIQETQI
jgi:glutamyl-tRNA reductase